MLKEKIYGYFSRRKLIKVPFGIMIEYFATSRATTYHKGFMLEGIFLVVEEREKVLCVVIDIVGLLEEAWTQKIIQDLSKFRMGFQIFDMLLFDWVLDGSKVGL